MIRGLTQSAVAVAALVLLAGCDGPEIRKNLAQCKLSAPAYAVGYLADCMQSRGYVVDERKRAGRRACIAPYNPEIEADCYRSDDWWSDAAAYVRFGKH